MRLTKLSVEQIMEELNNPDLYFPKPFLHGEMRSILLEGGEDAERAEDFLRKLLDSDNSDDKIFALSCLRDLEYLDEETYEKLQAFSKKPANKKICQEVGEPII